MNGGARETARTRRGWRAVDGIVLLDKPAGLSSNQALQRVRRVLGAAKAGHAGTLDPMATGMLPLCFGQATKACGVLLGARKAYRVRLRLGQTTDTGDARGVVTAEAPVPPLDADRVAAVLGGSVGTREQVPPMYSALKRDGERLYALARRGETVERAPRRVELYALALRCIDGAEIEFDVECSKGTYVRVLGEELAGALGSVGHLAALRRLWVEPFETEAMVGLEDVERLQVDMGRSAAAPRRPSWLLPVDRALQRLPRLDLDAHASDAVRHGRPVRPPEPIEPGVRLCAYDDQGALLGLMTAGPDGLARVARLLVAGAS